MISYRNKLERKKGQYNQILSNIQNAKKEYVRFKTDLLNIEKANVIIQEVAKETQNQITFHISNIVTLALNSIFPEPYEFKIDFIEKRGKTEADIYFLRNGVRVDPLSSSGGGVVDVVSFALRVSLLILSRKSKIIILDEPFKFLSRELQPKASEMLKEISYKLGIQFIIVTHDKALIDSADKVFINKIQDGISILQEGAPIEN